MTISRFSLQAAFVILSCVMIIFLPVLLLPIKHTVLDNFYVKTIQISTYTNLLAFISCLILIYRFDRFTGNSKISSSINMLLGSYFALMMMIFLLRLPYSIKTLAIGLMIAAIQLALMVRLNLNKSRLTLALIPSGYSQQFKSIKQHQFSELSETWMRQDNLSVLKNYDGLVVDFRSGALSQAWESFVARAAIHGIPVYSAHHLYESMTGSVDIKHLMENNLGVLAPSKLYMMQKRCLESLLIIIFSPLIILLSIIVALMVTFDGYGKVVFVQERIGLAGRVFKMYKFRTMTPYDPSKPQKLSDDHHRVTPIGAILRKYRLDELPQLWNVLKGEMSLIGPRPETAVLHAEYEKSVPFYAYRSIVRPGITGWAQVMHGYTSNSDQAGTKLTYDFYYIKHFSFWLDLLIVFRTIRVILSGFGAR